MKGGTNAGVSRRICETLDIDCLTANLYNVLPNLLFRFFCAVGCPKKDRLPDTNTIGDSIRSRGKSPKATHRTHPDLLNNNSAMSRFVVTTGLDGGRKRKKKA